MSQSNNKYDIVVIGSGYIGLDMTAKILLDNPNKVILFANSPDDFRLKGCGIQETIPIKPLPVLDDILKPAYLYGGNQRKRYNRNKYKRK